MISNVKDNRIKITCDTLPSGLELDKANYFRSEGSVVELVNDNDSNHSYTSVAQSSEMFDISTSKTYMYKITSNPDAITGQTGEWVEVSSAEAFIW